MKALVVYDSKFGNTGKIAQAIGKGLETGADVEVKNISEVHAGDQDGRDLVIVGSPTHGFKPTPAIAEWIKGIQPSLKGVKVAAFDTRITDEKIGENKVLRFFVHLFGFAAAKIASNLVKKGGAPVVPPEGFYVVDTEGPLLDGELERAVEWGKKVLAG